jgi:hypothetical protein
MNYVLIIEREGNDDQLAALSVHKTLKAAEAALLRYVGNNVYADLAAAPGPDFVERLADYGERARLFECPSEDFVRSVTPFARDTEDELEEEVA